MNVSLRLLKSTHGKREVQAGRAGSDLCAGIRCYVNMQAIKGGRSREVEEVNAKGSMGRVVSGAVFVVEQLKYIMRIDKTVYCYKDKEWSTSRDGGSILQSPARNKNSL